MSIRFSLAAFVLATLCLFPCVADGAARRTCGSMGCNKTPIYGVCCCWCPDDYCYKPMPCPPLLPPCGCANDYCGKPLPCPPLLPPCGCVNDYCPKPPVSCPRNCEPWYRCVPYCLPMGR